MASFPCFCLMHNLTCSSTWFAMSSRQTTWCLQTRNRVPCSSLQSKLQCDVYSSSIVLSWFPKISSQLLVAQSVPIHVAAIHMYVLMINKGIPSATCISGSVCETFWSCICFMESRAKLALQCTTVLFMVSIDAISVCYSISPQFKAYS